MKRLILSMAVLLASVGANAIPSQLNCMAKDVQSNESGSIRFSFEPFLAIWTGDNHADKIFFAENNICGIDTSSLITKPTCTFKDASSNNHLYYNLSCQTENANGTAKWFAKGGLGFSEITGSGRFECHTNNNGSGHVLAIDLSACH